MNFTQKNHHPFPPEYKHCSKTRNLTFGMKPNFHSLFPKIGSEIITPFLHPPRLIFKGSILLRGLDKIAVNGRSGPGAKARFKFANSRGRSENRLNHFFC